MGETATFRIEDTIGLLVAVGLHALLAAVLVLQMFFTPDPFVPPQRVTVSLATEVSLESTAPDPVPESRAAIAPTLAEIPAPPAETAPPTPREAVTPPPPQPRAQPSPRPQPRTQPQTPPRQQPRTQPRNPPPTDTRDRRRPEPARSPAPAARSPAPAGGSRIGDNFLEGQGASTRTDETRAPAATFGRAERAALESAITRALRPHWSAPTGVDADKLVSIVSWRLNQDGTLNGRPTCRNEPSSITDSNRPQAALHCERAIRAVQLAAPFNLPAQFYSRWDDLEWQFDRRL